MAGELGKEAELPEKLSSNLDSDRQVEVTDLAEPELMDPVPENIGHNGLKYFANICSFFQLIRKNGFLSLLQSYPEKEVAKGGLDPLLLALTRPEHLLIALLGFVAD